MRVIKKEVDTLRRKIYTELLKWKEEEAGRTALLIDGARRVGKSYIVENFAKQEYKSYIIIDFNRVNQEVTELFENYLNDLDLFFMYLILLFYTFLSFISSEEKYWRHKNIIFITIVSQ